MPGRELGGSVEALESPVLGFLKAHKNLPRRNVHLNTADKTAQLLENARSLRRHGAAAPYSTSERIKSWIPAPTSIHIIPVIGHPLTPPLAFRDNFKSWIDDKALREHDFSGHTIGSTDPDLVVQNSPPTPEKTPPKTTSRITIQTSASSSRDISDSRTESFRTANEDFLSGQRGGSPEYTALPLPKQNFSNGKGNKAHENFGLGLGLESEDDEPTPRKATPEPRDNRAEFVTFDGVWGGSTPHRINDQLQQRARKHTTSVTPPVSLERSPLLPHENDGGNSGHIESLNLRERVELKRASPASASTEHFGEKIDWPLNDELQDLDFDFQEVNDKRVSQASTVSTVVAAMVYDSPPRRRQTLRHTGKMIDPSLSDVSASRPNQNPLVSAHPPLRRSHQKLHSPDDNLRRSFSANNSGIGSQDKPLMVIPDRRSSLYSSTACSKRLSKTFSTASYQQSSRPTTAPEESGSYFDIPRHDHRRSVSVVIQQARPLNKVEKITQELLSPSTTNTSPPSMPVSSALSHSTSAASGAGRTRRITPSLSVQPSANLSELEGPDAYETSADPVITGDWSVSRPRSAMVTPFSLRSAHSSTPGTLEVNEATALSIYPHTNKSILVIQEIASKDQSKPREHSTIIAGNASIAIPGVITPVFYQEPVSRQVTQSPLQNPRDPPQPPELIQIIPPTPANAPRSSEDSRQATPPIKAHRMSAPFSSMKRALSARRYSESFRLPLSRSLSKRYSSGEKRYSFEAQDDKESRLHPSWKPRGLPGGDYDSDSESEFGNDGLLISEPQIRKAQPTRTMSLTDRITGSIRNASMRHPRRASSVSGTYMPSSQPLPYEVVDDAIKRSQPLARRLTGSLRLPRSRRPQQSKRASWSAKPHFEVVRSNADDVNGKMRQSVPAQGYQVQFVGFRGVLDKFEKRRESKQEDRREARREWLRGRIDLVGPNQAHSDLRDTNSSE